MKNIKVPVLKKVRVRTNQEEYFTYSNWEIKEIDGVAFLPVIKTPQNKTPVRYIRKDSLEFIK